MCQDKEGAIDGQCFIIKCFFHFNRGWQKWNSGWSMHACNPNFVFAAIKPVTVMLLAIATVAWVTYKFLKPLLESNNGVVS